MSYQEALEAAGATVTAFEWFGSYQGDWFARVGDTVVPGSYGSCSGCDAFEAEFGYGSDACGVHRYDDTQDSCSACQEAQAGYQSRLAEFGRGYLDAAVSIGSPEYAALIKEFREQSSWDMDAPAIVKWLEGQAAS